jgi:hypothetical protein
MPTQRKALLSGNVYWFKSIVCSTVQRIFSVGKEDENNM